MKRFRRIQFAVLSVMGLLVATPVMPLHAQRQQTILGRKEPEKKPVIKKEAPKQDTVPATPAQTGTAAIAGLVVDSLHGTYLRHADVMIEGAQINTTTDSTGRFKVSGLKPGDYQVGVFHPVLDSLGVSLATRKFYVGPDSTSFVMLAVPSALTIIKTSCPPLGPRAQGTSAVIGRVTDPETMQPVKGAEVSIAWTQIEVSKEIGVRRTPRLLRDSTNATGDYRICGLPSDMHATLQARTGDAVTAEVPITLGTEQPELFLRNLLLSQTNFAAKTGNAVVSGTVILEGSPSNAGSRVELVGTDIVAMTNEKGQFTMRNLPSGSHVLLARHLGFGAETVPVDLTSRDPRQVTIKLPKFVATIEPVVVTAKRAANLDKVGFTQRQKSGTGFYLGPEQIERMQPIYLTDILRTVPGLQVSYGPQGEEVTSSRGVSSLSGANCVQYIVDDMPWQSLMPGDVNQFVNGREVVGIEVYNGPGTPPQYQRAGQGNCTTIVVWTKFKIRS
ncbi:MAG TPA: carboxypeptidase regulatory-like domain-containing protein [Gemmatimonadaceae bacterium]|nr:carboxypeptidase regulatory-like domain-containing protein [Gemmatimonadaceae bacterium]